MCIAYIIRQLVCKNLENVLFLCRNTPKHIAEKWLNDFGIRTGNLDENKGAGCCIQAINESSFSKTSFSSFLYDNNNYYNSNQVKLKSAFVVADFDITDTDICLYSDYISLINTVAKENITFIYTGYDCTFNDWQSSIVTMNSTTISVTTRPNISGYGIEIVPFKWRKKHSETFCDLASLNYSPASEDRYKLVAQKVPDFKE